MNLLVLSGVASAINYIQSLAGASDIRLFVSDSDPYCPGLYVPGVTPVPLPRARADNYREELAAALSRHAIDALIPTSDYDVEAVVRWQNDGWDPPVLMFRPPFAAYARLGYKDRLAAHLAARFPEAIPRSAAVARAAQELDFPFVLKPANLSGGKGVSICRGPGDFAAARERLLLRYGEPLLAQQYIPGATYVLTLVYGHDGQVAASVGMRSRLTFFTWGGGGMAGELADEPELDALARALVAEAGGWRGPINLEFRRHPDTGRFFLMEANCRLNGYSYLTTMNGINLPRITVDALCGRRVAPPSPPPPEERSNFCIGYRETPVEAFLA